MTVFKGFLIITKRNLGLMFMYIAIFLTIAISVQKSGVSNTSAVFEQTSLEIAVIDRDGGAVAQGLTDYLGKFHTIKNVPDTPSDIQSNLFYRNIFYLVTIPEDFETKCLLGNEKLAVTKVPGSNSGYYVDQQINTYLNEMRVLTASGFSADEANQIVLDNLSHTSEITLLDKNGHGGGFAMHSFMYQFMPYIILAILCYVICTIMIAFNKPDVKHRMTCSAVSNRSLNLQMVLGYSIIGIAVWIICTLLPLILYGKEFLADPNFRYYLINSFLMMLVALSLAFLLSIFIKSDTITSVVVNVVTLGMSFLCGVFVSMDILSKGVKMIAQFLPVYWYETANELIAANVSFSSTQLHTLYTSFGIQLLFAAAFLGIALMAGKVKSQAAQ